MDNFSSPESSLEKPAPAITFRQLAAPEDPQVNKRLGYAPSKSQPRTHRFVIGDQKQKASKQKIREAQTRKKQFDETCEGEASAIDASKRLEENREQIRRETEGMTPAQRRRHRREKIREAEFRELWPEEELQEAHR